MAVYLDARNRFQRDGGRIRLECPRCNNFAAMQVTGPPDFEDLQRNRPEQAGIVLRCESCAAPVFLRYRLKSISPDRIDFHAGALEVERPPEKFRLEYLPAPVAAAFRDALGCYSHGLSAAFALSCACTARAMFADLGGSTRLRIFDQVAEIQALAEIDADTFDRAKQIIFDGSIEQSAEVPSLTRAEAAVLLEVMKDMLYQSYVRAAKLRRALRIRQHFAAGEDDDSLIVRAVRRAGDLG